MSKRKIALISISSLLVIILGIGIYFYVNKTTDSEIYQAKVEEKVENQIGGFLTLMLETEAGSGQYQESTSGTWPGDDYEFNGTLSACQNGGELSWDSSTNSVKLLANSSDACYVYFDKKVNLASVCNPDETLSECIINYYNITGDMDNGIYYHDADLVNGAGDNSYRYAGANPNNYVCFGSDATICPEDNLYRIIGVFGSEIKLIKSTAALTNLLGTDGAYYSGYQYRWNNNTNTNVWSESNLNTVNLNQVYLTNIGNSWDSLISYHNWKVGGMSRSNGTGTPQTAYNYEVGVNSSSTTYDAKIGLMYVSDYGFAASSDYWATPLNKYDEGAQDYDWMYLGSDEWTITRHSDNSNIVFYVIGWGYIYNYVILNSSSARVRPVFYLNSNVQYSSGTGTQSDPIRLVV